MIKKLLLGVVAVAVLAIASMGPPSARNESVQYLSPAAYTADDEAFPARAVLRWQADEQQAVDMINAAEKCPSSRDMDQRPKKGSAPAEQHVMAPSHPLLL